MSEEKTRSLSKDGRSRRTLRKQRPASDASPAQSSRRASSLRWVFMLFAASLAVLLLLLVSDTADETYVVRTSGPVPAFTVISPSDLEAALVDVRAVEPDAFSADTAEEAIAAASEYVVGRWLSAPAGERQQLRTTMFGAARELRTPLGPSERLVSITAEAPQAVAGQLRAGDRVDVLVATSGGLTGVLGQDVELVSVSLAPSQFASIASRQLTQPERTISDIAPDDPLPGTYVLRVDVQEVASYIAADASGTIYLVLRGPDAADARLEPESLITVICRDDPFSPACALQIDPGSLAPATPPVALPAPTAPVFEDEASSTPEGDGVPEP